MDTGIVESGDFKKLCDFIYNANDGGEKHCGKSCLPGSIVFCKIDNVFAFFEQIRLTRKRVVLVTGEGDLACGKVHQEYLPENVWHWFATNVSNPHERVTALPLGLGPSVDPNTVSAKQINQIRTENSTRDKWLYVNFRPETNPQIRQPIFNHFKIMGGNEPWITFQNPADSVSHEMYLHNLISHRFVLCPPGNGVDTHRMWETLAAGSIPVVLRSRVTDPFEKLRILFVDQYEEVTNNMLEDAWDKMKSSSANEPMLLSQYWAQKIRVSKVALAGNEIIPCNRWISESIKYGIGMMKRRLAINNTKYRC